MRLMVLICSAFVLLAPSMGGQEQTHQPNQQQQKGASPPQAQIPPSAAGSAAVRQPTAEAEDKRKTEKQTYLQHLIAPDVLPNWMLSIVGAIGVLLA